ncbi:MULTISPECIES: hypothetical protein [Yersinia]|uniref:Uncharacterized protein n=1 Tax=Yersinia aleksiciae TaxID=263819 RepID=A0A0T9V1A1_YERAE|nr:MULTISPECIES: hypothetical protein [Yersinia]RXA93700.1 hypothetical protein EQP49_22695 [Yersinia sp. 2105 StPb PI]CNL94320.1 Uncharacterised protein [Yersinia aleksiciae]CQD57599.1 Uncharacterised protein [Yersinia enterocolitica]
MTTDNVRNISDYKKKDDNVNADSNIVADSLPLVRLSDKLRGSIAPGLKQQMRQQMRKKNGF